MKTMPGAIVVAVAVTAAVVLLQAGQSPRAGAARQVPYGDQ
ncbi:MAG: hypothetical protein AB7I25_12420 [Vicinamibacterales bacterium]